MDGRYWRSDVIDCGESRLIFSVLSELAYYWNQRLVFWSQRRFSFSALAQNWNLQFPAETLIRVEGLEFKA